MSDWHKNMPVPEALIALCAICEKNGISLIIEYENGRFSDNRKGWCIEVDSSFIADEHGLQTIYPTLGEAVHAGLSWFKPVLNGKP